MHKNVKEDTLLSELCVFSWHAWILHIFLYICTAPYPLCVKGGFFFFALHWCWQQCGLWISTCFGQKQKDKTKQMADLDLCDVCVNLTFHFWIHCFHLISGLQNYWVPFIFSTPFYLLFGFYINKISAFAEITVFLGESLCANLDL